MSARAGTCPNTQPAFQQHSQQHSSSIATWHVYLHEPQQQRTCPARLSGRRAHTPSPASAHHQGPGARRPPHRWPEWPPAAPGCSPQGCGRWELPTKRPNRRRASCVQAHPCAAAAAAAPAPAAAPPWARQLRWPGRGGVLRGGGLPCRWHAPPAAAPAPGSGAAGRRR